MPTIDEIITAYYDYRGMPRPNSDQALKFLVSEVGELADADVSSTGEWLRNTPGKERSVPLEVGDVQMMLAVYAAANGLDPVGCMLDKMRSKGFEPPVTD